jgi:hypothetical protein
LIEPASSAWSLSKISCVSLSSSTLVYLNAKKQFQSNSTDNSVISYVHTQLNELDIAGILIFQDPITLDHSSSPLPLAIYIGD